MRAWQSGQRLLASLSMPSQIAAPLIPTLLSTFDPQPPLENDCGSTIDADCAAHDRRARPMLKLPGHTRYSYSPIVKRTDYSWPEGKRLAFYIALNIEHFAFGTGIGMDPSNRGGPQTTRNYAWRDYGNRIGNWRLFEILDELKLPASILLNSLVCDQYPDIVEKIRQRGDDVCGHGRTNAEVLRPMWEHDEACDNQECTETIGKHVGVKPTGWMG